MVGSRPAGVESSLVSREISSSGRLLRGGVLLPSGLKVLIDQS